VCALPAGAQASTVLRVDHGRWRGCRTASRPRRARCRRPGGAAGQAGAAGADRRADTGRAQPPGHRLTRARAARDTLPAGAPRDELSAVIATTESLDASGQLTSSRVNAIELILRRNTEFWPISAPPASGTRVTFAGSPLLFEYYPGQGLQIQPLGNFGKANAAWSTCNLEGDHTCTPLRTLLDAMISLASVRGTFTAWEYCFAFEGGAPPWISSMSQARASSRFRARTSSRE
jgi:hypothetical protein